MALKASFRYMNQYDLHKKIINEYVLQRPGDTSKFQRDTSKDKRDIDVIRENHKFIWDTEEPETWEAQFAKKYYDRLFKEYCICDLTLYKANKIAMRWRIEKEVINGKGQFICGNKACTIEKHLRTWEINFGYVEQGEKKNALVKIRLCSECSLKLNYHSKKREVKRLKRKKFKKSDKHRDLKSKSSDSDKTNHDSTDEEASTSQESSVKQTSGDNEEANPWENIKPTETKTREEEMEEYLEELLL